MGGSARIAQSGYAAGQAPTVGGVAYQIAGGATEAIGTTEAVDGTSLTVKVDDDKTLLRGADLQATVVPHAVLRLGSVDTALSSVSARLISGTMQAGDNTFSLNDGDTQVTLNIRNPEFFTTAPRVTLEKWETDGELPAISLGALLTEDQSGGLYRIDAFDDETVTIALLEGRWITSAGTDALDSLKSEFRSPERALATHTLGLSAFAGTKTPTLPNAGEVWTVVNSEVDAILYITDVDSGSGTVSFEMLSGRLGTGFL